MYLWILRRFLEYGRAVDVLRFFSLDEIAAHRQDLRVSDYANRKWRRLEEVYRARYVRLVTRTRIVAN